MTNNLRQDIVSRITNHFNVKNIILFGSHAWGTQTQDSDIDLLIVLDEKGFAKSYMDRLMKSVAISKVLDSIERSISIDLLVYTSDEWDLLLAEGSSFTRSISERGERLV